jgi:heme/copper-type cytochrome/quinol oxidase subunit 1
MTVTETRPAAAATQAESAVVAASPRARARIVEWLDSADHTKVGRLYMGMALAYLVGALVIGALLGLERIDDSASQIIGSDTVAQLYSLYRVGLVFCVVLPLLLGLAIAVVPLQVGARGVAFPRAAALSFWAWLFGSGVLVAAYAANGGPAGGKAQAVDLFFAALVVVVVALLLAAVCVATTVLTLRAPGMWLDRVPFFAWSAMAAGVVLLLSLPVLVGEAILLYVDHRYGRVAFGDNGAPAYLAWVFAPPQVYAFALPVLGLAADVGAVFARARHVRPDAMLVVIGLGAVVGFGAWVQPALYPDVTSNVVYKAVLIVALVPPLAVLGLVAMTARAGRPRFGSPGVWAAAAVLMLLAGAALGVLLPFEGLDLQGTVATFSLFNYVLLAGALGGLGGLVYWGPKLWGRRLPEAASAGLGALGLVGVVLVAFPDVILGFLDQPVDAVSDFGIDGPVALLNAVTVVGYVLLLLVVVALALLALRGFAHGPLAGDDPWDGQTLEWAVPSPPGAVVDLPAVTSAQPLLDRRAARGGAR